MVSYWDPAYGGRIFGPLEHLLDLSLSVYLLVAWWGRRVETPLGDFETEVCHLPDGPVTLTIRPEDIVFNGAATKVCTSIYPRIKYG